MSNALESETSRRGFFKILGKTAGLVLIANQIPFTTHAESNSDPITDTATEEAEIETTQTNDVLESNQDKQSSLATFLDDLKIEVPDAVRANQFVPFLQNNIDQPLNENSLRVPTFDKTNLAPDSDVYFFKGFGQHEDLIIAKHSFNNSGDPKTVLFISVDIGSFPNQHKFLTSKDVVAKYGEPDKVVTKDYQIEMVYGKLGASFGYPNVFNHFGSDDIHLIKTLNIFEPMAADKYEAGWFKAV